MAKRLFIISLLSLIVFVFANAEPHRDLTILAGETPTKKPGPTNTPHPNPPTVTPTPTLIPPHSGPTPDIPNFPQPLKETGTLIDGVFTPRSEFVVGQELVIKLSVFGANTTGPKIPVDGVLIMDRSESMAWRWDGEFDLDPDSPFKMEVAIDAMKSFVDQADPSSDQIALASYCGGWCAPRSSLDEPLTSDFAALKDEIDNLRGREDGTTSIGLGLEEGNKEIVNNSRPEALKYIILATDGLQNRGPAVFGNNILESTKNLGVPVFTVAFGDDSLGNDGMSGNPWTCPHDGSTVNDGTTYMQCIANYTGGKYFFAPNPEDLADVFDQINNIILEWQTEITDYINDTYVTGTSILDVTDLAGNSVSHSLTLTGNRVSGSLGTLNIGEGRHIYIIGDTISGASGSSWTFQADSLPNSNNVVNYYNPNDGTLIATEIFNNNPSVTVRFANAATIQGSVYEDNDGSCSYGGAPDVGSDNASVTLTRQLPATPTCPSYTQTITPNSDGTFTFTGLDCFNVTNKTVDATYQLSYSSTSSQFTDRCGNLFNITVNDGETYSQNLALVRVKDPWMQGVNGGMHATGSITTNIPSSATEPYLLTNSGSSDTGIAISTGLSLGEGGISQTGQFAIHGSTPAPSIDFDQLRTTIIDVADETTYSGSSPSPSDRGSDGVAVYYTSSDLTLSGDWRNINFPVIVFADGDVTIPDTISQSEVTLNPQGFLMIVARDDILISGNIGADNPSDTDVQLEGLFIAGQNFNAGGSADPAVDKRLNVSGSIVVGARTTGSYLSNRSHRDNYLHPSDSFSYNGILVDNFPEFLAQPIYSWQEVR